jgi:hypothetical protein
VAWAIYADDGIPEAETPHGLTAETRQPMTVLHVWENEQAMRHDMESGRLFRCERFRLVYGVVGEWTSGGLCRLEIHGNIALAPGPRNWIMRGNERAGSE